MSLKQNRFQFNRMELAGSLGDLGTLLPLAVGMILVNGLSPAGLFFSIGLFYVAAGAYYGVTVPVQPMKVIGAYAVATALSAQQVSAAGLMIALLLLLVGGYDIIARVQRFIPTAVIRGVQLSTGALLLAQGVKLAAGTSTFQQLHGGPEPYLKLQQLGPVPMSIPISILGSFLVLRFLNNKKIPAGILVVGLGLGLGILFGTHVGWEDLKPGIYWPGFLPRGLPTLTDFSFAFMILVLPQLPMTVGNAAIANADLSLRYFPHASGRVTARALCISMGLANLVSFMFGGMPLCHGAGGLAAHYRFGARTAGSNLMIGVFFLGLALFLGEHALAVVTLIPLSILGVLLMFAGAQLCLTLMDMNQRKELFVCFAMLGITLASNLAAGFGVGVLLAHGLKSGKLHI